MKTTWAKAAPLLALNVVFWLAYAAMVGVLWVIGVPLIWWAVMKMWRKAEFSRVFPGRLVVRWRKQWMNPVWGNEQDGIDGLPINHPSSLAWWSDKMAELGIRQATFQWSALRNSTNNLRFMHYFVPWLGWINPNTIEPKRIRWAGSDAPLDSVMRMIAMDGPLPIGRMKYVRRVACLFVSQGLYAGLRIAVRFRGRAHQIWFGWKLNPGMAVEGWWPDDPCWKGVGFTCGQVRHSA